MKRGGEVRIIGFWLKVVYENMGGYDYRNFPHSRLLSTVKGCVNYNPFT